MCQRISISHTNTHTHPLKHTQNRSFYTWLDIQTDITQIDVHVKDMLIKNMCIDTQTNPHENHTYTIYSNNIKILRKTLFEISFYYSLLTFAKTYTHSSHYIHNSHNSYISNRTHTQTHTRQTKAPTNTQTLKTGEDKHCLISFLDKNNP